MMMEAVRLTQMVKTSGCAAKLPPALLHEVLDSLPVMHSPNLEEGYEGSDDACVYRINEDLLMLQTVDFFPPMVDDPYLFGQVAAANALSDIYAMGGDPKLALNLVCFPSCLDLSVLRQILLGGQSKVEESGAVIAGGHTISDATPKYGLCVTGFAQEGKVWANKGARVGDVLILTKALGVGIINTAVKAGLASEEAAQAAIASMTTL
ncbi:selenide, water dikinase SelD, partial [Sphaerochaeta sp.]|uniref:selenide, water dikinase SelD n=1 Tax=Sphaerochaeta sp. TaxID=1972642 RepID=UPI003D12EED1